MDYGRYIMPSEASKISGFSSRHLRRLNDECKIKSRKTSKGHRRYLLDDILEIKKQTIKPVLYLSPNSMYDEEDTKDFFKEDCDVIKDDKERTELRKMIKKVVQGDYNKIVILNKYAFGNHNVPLIILEGVGIEIEVLKMNDENSNVYDTVFGK